MQMEKEADVMDRSLEDSMDLFLRRLEDLTSGPCPFGVPELSGTAVEEEMGSIIKRLQDPDTTTRAQAAQDCCELIKELNVHDPIEMPWLPQLVIVLCLSIESNTEAAKTLCSLIPLLCQKQRMQRRGGVSREALTEALTLIEFEPVPDSGLLVKDSSTLVKVFGGLLSSLELLEAICFLLAASPGAAFTYVDMNNLFQQFLKEFLGKVVKVDALLDALLQQTLGHSQEEQPLAFAAFGVLATEHLEEVANHLLKHPFSKCQDQWMATYGAKKAARLINILIKAMENNYHDEAVLACSICAIRGFLKARPFRKQCCQYSALLLLLLGAISLTNECAREALDTLEVFLKAARVPADALGCLQQLGNPSTHRLGLSTLVRSLCSSSRDWAIPLAEYSVGFLAQKIQAGLHRSTQEFYTELLLYHVEAEAHNKSPDSLLCWLDHGSLVAKKLSLRGITGLVCNSELKEDPWSVQLILLSTLGSIAPDQLNRAMERLEEMLPTLREEEEAVFHRKLAASCCALMDHEVAAVRAAAINHLGRLKYKSTAPQSPEEAIGELVDVLIHLGDRPEVATAAMTTLFHLVPQVQWKVERSLHHVLHQAAKYLSKTYSTEHIHGAVLNTLQHPTLRTPGLIEVAVFFVGHLVHKKAKAFRREDLEVYASLLQKVREKNNRALTEAAERTLLILQAALRRNHLPVVQRFCCTCLRTCRKYPKEYKAYLGARE